MSLAIHAIRHHQHQDGPGQRSVIWVAGCTLRCPGCINPHLWDRAAGPGMSVAAVLDALEPGRRGGDVGVTVVGGEPFEQDDLGALCAAIAARWPRVPGVPRLIVYTGYTLAQLRLNANTLTALATSDVLVDGPFIAARAAPDLGYRGSANQRVLDLAAARRIGARSRAAARRVGARRVGARRVGAAPGSLADAWDRPRITVSPAGVWCSPSLARHLGLPTDRTRQCGQDERSRA